MKVSEGLRKAFKRLEGGKKWFSKERNGRADCFCAATATGRNDRHWADTSEVKYLYRALPKWAQRQDGKEPTYPKHWEYVANYNDDSRCEFKHISALYGKAIKLAEIDEAEAAGLVGKARLLRVALALREVRNPKFDMSMYLHECGTPACAFGHYAARTDLQTAFKIGFRHNLADVLTTEGNFGGYSRQLEHFQITLEDWDKLFSGNGCGNAQTAIEAADYIENFAHTKWSTP